MTPEGQKEVAAMIAEMRAIRPAHVLSPTYAEVEMIRLQSWADRLALLLAEANPQVEENKDVTTRVDTMGDSTDNPTAAPDVAEGERSTTPDHGRNPLAGFTIRSEQALRDVQAIIDSADRLSRRDPGLLWPDTVAAAMPTIRDLIADLYDAVRDSGGGNRPPSGLRGDPVAPRTVNVPNATNRSHP